MTGPTAPTAGVARHIWGLVVRPRWRPECTDLAVNHRQRRRSSRQSR